MSTASLCQLLGKSRQAYYKQCSMALHRLDQEAIVVEDVLRERVHQPRIGTIKLHETLKGKWKSQGVKVGRDQLYAILAHHHLLIRRRKRRVPRTTWSNHPFRTYPDLAGDFVPSQPHQLYVADITYLPLADGRFCYLFLMTDAYSRVIVAHAVAPGLQMKYALQVLHMANAKRDPQTVTIHHSDRGIQYCSPRYTHELIKTNYRISMTQTSDPRDNAIAERVNGILKHELIYPFGSIPTLDQAVIRVNKAVEIYNSRRLHLSCDLKTPWEIHHTKQPTKRRWKKTTVNL